MNRKGEVIVECQNPHWAMYVTDKPNEDRVGHYGLYPTHAMVPLVPGLRYRVTFEVIGTGKDRPKLIWYWRNWCGPKEQRRAKAYFKSRKQQKEFPCASKHMQEVLIEAKRCVDRYRRDVRIWREARQLT